MSRRAGPTIVRLMYHAYEGGLTFAEVGRMFNRHPQSVRELFERRGLPLRPSTQAGKVHLANGCFAPAKPLTDAQVEALIASATKIAIPADLRLEWRKWTLDRRAWFIGRLRERFKSEKDRPDLPFSSNVTPFDYGTPAAWEIVRRMNEGTDSRSARMKIDLVTQGVIYQDELWFWSHKIGYQRGRWIPGIGRPSLHRTIWETHHGRAVSPEDVVRHIDGNPNNLSPENLTVSSRNELCRENQAAALLRKSREQTSLILNRSQRKDKSHGLLAQLHQAR